MTGRSVNAIRLLQLSHVTRDVPHVRLGDQGLRRHVSEPPMVSTHPALHGQCERDVGVVRRSVDGIDQRRPRRTAHRMLAMARGAAHFEGLPAGTGSGGELGYYQRPPGCRRRQSRRIGPDEVPQPDDDRAKCHQSQRSCRRHGVAAVTPAQPPDEPPSSVEVLMIDGGSLAHRGEEQCKRKEGDSVHPFLAVPGVMETFSLRHLIVLGLKPGDVSDRDGSPAVPRASGFSRTRPGRLPPAPPWTR